jgi:hypothetical protein
VADFSEYFDESKLTFYNKQDAIITYNDMVDDALVDNKDVNRYDNTTWEDEDEVTLFSETDNGDGSTDAFFGILDVYWTYRIGKINLTV